MRCIVAGSRAGFTRAQVRAAIHASGWEGTITSVLEGGAPGVDRLGREWATESCLPVLTVPADWVQHGKAAGPRRNAKMAELADALIAVWDGRSRGTKDMIDRARARGLKVFVWTGPPAVRRDPPPASLETAS